MNKLHCFQSDYTEDQQDKGSIMYTCKNKWGYALCGAHLLVTLIPSYK